MDVHWVEEKAIWFARSSALHGNPGGGGGGGGWGGPSPLQEAKGDVPLNGVPIIMTGATIMGRIFNGVTRMRLQIFGFWG